jgi:N-acetylmuramoyl-L-alanine amidase
VAIAKALGMGGPKPVQSLKMGLFRGLMVPVCVVETDFVSRPEGLASLSDPAARQALADKLSAGIAAYAGLGGPDAAP